jgi:hypothetical protein
MRTAVNRNAPGVETGGVSLRQGGLLELALVHVLDLAAVDAHAVVQASVDRV